MTPYRIERLTAAHDRDGFSSGVEALDRYLKVQARQDARRSISTCYVAVAQQGNVLAGYYTLSMSSVPLLDLPQPVTRRLPRYPTLPAARLGRLAVDTRFRGQGLGRALLESAIQRIETAEIAAFAVVVDAKDDAAALFYSRLGFVALRDTPLTLFLPVSPQP